MQTLQAAPNQVLTAAAPKKLAFVDALRGFAVMLVIVCHTGGVSHQLPYPIKKLTNLGWHGVQLFFLLSCVTLLLSWYSDEAKGQTDVLKFWARRLFRIAPMYYCGALIYAALEPPSQGFSFDQLLASMIFVNAWYPTLIPTTPGWMVVPGGWSVSVEFTFYFVFPLMALLVRSLRSALGFTALALALGCIANLAARGPLLAAYGQAATDNFLYFWFPHQLPVFALGTVLYFVLRGLWANPGGQPAARLRRHAPVILSLCAAAMALAAYLPFPNRLPLALPLLLPTLLVVSLIFMLAIAVLAVAPVRLVVNPLTCALGRLSFSAYVVHFGVLHQLPKLFPAIFIMDATGLWAIFHCAVLGVATIAVTFAVSWVTFTWIETPMIEAGRKILARGRRVAPAAV